MNDAQQAAVAAIEQQQKKLQEGTAPWVVGEQLKELCMAEPESAALLLEDLKNENMALTAAEKEIKKWADAHRTGDFTYVSPQKAEEILRKFYGLRSAGRQALSQPTADSSLYTREPLGGGSAAGAPHETSGFIDLAAFL